VWWESGERNKKNKGVHGLCLVQEPGRTAFSLVSLFAPYATWGVITARSAIMGVLLIWKVAEGWQAVVLTSWLGRRKVSTRSTVRDWTRLLLVNMPCSHVHNSWATGDSRSLATKMAVTETVREKFGANFFYTIISCVLKCYKLWLAHAYKHFLVSWLASLPEYIRNVPMSVRLSIPPCFSQTESGKKGGLKQYMLLFDRQP
jgi:hypothetical protein